MLSERRLSEFRGYKLGILKRTRKYVWLLIQNIFFKRIFLPSSVRKFILVLFGASVGKNVLLRHGVQVHYPWNLEIGEDCWIGEGVWFINHEKIRIGSNVCISQRALICSSGHDFHSASLDYLHKPIEIKNGAWICLDAKVLPGVTIGECSVVSAGEVVRKSLPNYSMLIDGQVLPIDPPK